jgi:D-alanyl-D-alanine carboxypeptidase
MVDTKAFAREVKRFFDFFAVFFLFGFVFCQTPAYGISQQADEDRTPRNDVAVTDGEYFKNTEQCTSPKINVRDDAVRAGLLYDMSSHQIIWEKNMNQAFPIASLTKMMVGLLAMEDIRAGKVRWNTLVAVTPEATQVGGFTVSLRSGRSLTMEDLVKAALISSGNDAAYTLAQFLGKTENNFVRRMNRRAAELGMNATRYSNPTGMPAARSCDDNHSSPADLLILCKEIYKYKDLMRIAGTSQDVITQDGRAIRLKNHNHLVADVSGVDGFKTGYTNNAKFCLAATASKDSRRIISIALGVDSRHLRDRFVKNIFCRYYDSLGMGSLEPRLQPGLQPGSGRTAVAKTGVVAPRRSSGPVVHRIKIGDSLFSISKAYGCSVAQLRGWNRLKGNAIKPGGKLKIYSKSNVMIASASQNVQSSVIYYTVRPGDTLWRISQKYDGLTVKKLMRINKIRQGMGLKTGDTLKIHLDRG